MDYGKSNVHSRVPMTLVHWLDDVGADCQVQLTFWNFTKDVHRTKQDEFCFSFVEL